MRMEREQFLGAGHYERVSRRRGNANGYKSNKVDTPAGTLSVSVPKTADHLEGWANHSFRNLWNGDGASVVSSCWPWLKCISKGT